MSDFWDRLFYVVICAIIGVSVILLGWVIVALIGDATHDAQGRVINKYYDDADVVCSKTCIVTSECWRVIVEDQPWFEDGICVSESYFQTVEIGDYIKE